VRPRHGIRANLPANQEHRLSRKKRVWQDAFGIYRPLTPESNEQVVEAVTKARKDIVAFFAEYRNSPAELVIPAETGVTFLSRTLVRHALGRGLVERFEAVELGRNLERLGAKPGQKPADFDVQLADTDWTTRAGRKLVYRFAENTPGERRLGAESKILQQALDGAKAGELPVEQPDHITLMKYGVPGDGRDLSVEHKQEVSHIVERHFSEAGIGSVALDRLVIGPTYNEQMELG